MHQIVTESEYVIRHAQDCNQNIPYPFYFIKLVFGDQ